MPIGETLAGARRASGMSVEQVSERTRIRATLVRAIEADEFDVCGGAVYARGHIRSIGRVVGVDPEPLVAEYDREHGGPPAGPPTLAVTAFEPAVEQASRPRRAHWPLAAGISLLVIIAFAAFALADSGPGRGSRPPTTPATAAKSPPATTPASPSPRPSPTALTVAGVNVQVLVIAADSWFSVTNSAGVVLFQGLLYAGQQRQFTDPKALSMVIGDAPVVHLVVNGHDIGSPIAAGNVARLTFLPGSSTPTPQSGTA